MTRHILSLPANADSERRTLRNTGLVDALSPDYIVDVDNESGKVWCVRSPAKEVTREEWAAIKAAI